MFSLISLAVSKEAYPHAIFSIMARILVVFLNAVCMIANLSKEFVFFFTLLFFVNLVAASQIIEMMVSEQITAKRKQLILQPEVGSFLGRADLFSNRQVS